MPKHAHNINIFCRTEDFGYANNHTVQPPLAHLGTHFILWDVIEWKSSFFRNTLFDSSLLTTKNCYSNSSGTTIIVSIALLLIIDKIIINLKT